MGNGARVEVVLIAAEVANKGVSNVINLPRLLLAVPLLFDFRTSILNVKQIF